MLKIINVKPVYRILGVAAVLAVGIPLVGYTLANGANSDAAPVVADNTIAAAPPAGMAGWTIPGPVNATTDQAAQITRGKYLVVAGDCLPCHSVSGQPAFSGGLAVGSPVGAVVSPNITSSKKYGIGNYTDRQFWRVLHDGIAPGSSLLVFPKYLYPSMPYDAYSKLSYPDVMAIKSYLMSLPAVETPNRPLQIPFPFDTRAALLGWRIFFFHQNGVQYDPGWSPQLRNGAFLVQALGHCSDCHTPRNLLMGSENSKFLGGGHILAQSWYAPNISSDKQDGVGGWDSAALVNYLRQGGALGPGAPVGPMQEVVNDSLSRLPASDIQDIAAYLQTGVGGQPAVALKTAAMPAQDLGAQIFADNCARCHGDNGEGVNNNFPNLAGNQSVWSGPANNVVSMLIGGFGPWHADQSAMPAFGATLTDTQIAAVSNYVRTAWGNKGSADATADMVGNLRPLTTTQITLDPGTTQARLGGTAATTIYGALSRDGNLLNCQLDGVFDSAHLSGACIHGGTALRGTMTMNGQVTPVTLALRTLRAGQAITGISLTGDIGAAKTPFAAQIAYTTPNN